MTNTYPPQAIPATARRWILLVESDSGAQFWQLRVEGTTGVVAQVARRGAFGPPPAILTEGLPFRPEYHSHESEVEGEPDVWVYVPGERRRVDPAWVSLIVIGISAALVSRWPLFMVPAALAAAWFLVLYRRDRKATS